MGGEEFSLCGMDRQIEQDILNLFYAIGTKMMRLVASTKS